MPRQLQFWFYILKYLTMLLSVGHRDRKAVNVTKPHSTTTFERNQNGCGSIQIPQKTLADARFKRLFGTKFGTRRAP